MPHSEAVSKMACAMDVVNKHVHNSGIKYSTCNTSVMIKYNNSAGRPRGESLGLTHRTGCKKAGRFWKILSTRTL